MNICKQPIKFSSKTLLFPSIINNINNSYIIGNIDLLNMKRIGFIGINNMSKIADIIFNDCIEQLNMKDIPIVIKSPLNYAMYYNYLKKGGKIIFIVSNINNCLIIKKKLMSVWNWEQVLIINHFNINQFITAFSHVIIIIEANYKSNNLNIGKEALKYNLPLYVVQYKDMSNDNLRGNHILLDMGALKIKKNKLNNRANLTNIFYKINNNNLNNNLYYDEYLLNKKQAYNEIKEKIKQTELYKEIEKMIPGIKIVNIKIKREKINTKNKREKIKREYKDLYSI